MAWIKKHPPLRRHEKATLLRSYAGEFGRGCFNAIRAPDFTILIITAYFGFRQGNAFWLWLLTAAPFIGMIFAVLGTVGGANYRKKSVIFAVEMLSRFLAIVAALLPDPRLFALVMSMAIALEGLIVPLINGIYGSNFNRMVRGHAMGRLQRVFVSGTALFSWLAGILLKADLSWYRYIIIGVSLLALIHAWYARGLPEPRKRKRRTRKAVWREFFHGPWRDPLFLYIELTWWIMGTSNLWLVPLRVLRLQDIHFDPKQILIATTTTVMIAQFFLTPLWGKVIYRLNLAWYRALCNLLFIFGIAIFFYSESFLLVCLGSLFWGAGFAGGSLSWRLVATFFAKADQGPVYTSAHTLLAGLRGMIGPFVSLLIYQSFGIQRIANISLFCIALSIVMILPVGSALERRQRKGA